MSASPLFGGADDAAKRRHPRTPLATLCGRGLPQVGKKIVRHNGFGWYEALDVDAAIEPENIPVSLTAGSVDG